MKFNEKKKVDSTPTWSIFSINSASHRYRGENLFFILSPNHQCEQKDPTPFTYSRALLWQLSLFCAVSPFSHFLHLRRVRPTNAAMHYNIARHKTNSLHTVSPFSDFYIFLLPFIAILLSKDMPTFPVPNSPICSCTHPNHTFALL